VAQRRWSVLAALLVLSLLGTGMAAGWGDLVASDDLTFADRSDDASAAPDFVSLALALPVTFLFAAPLFFAWGRLTVEQSLTSFPFLTAVQIPRAPPA